MSAREAPEDTEGTQPFGIGNLGRHTAIYGIGIVLSKAVSVLMLPIYTRWLTPADYGVLQLITMTFEIVTIIAGSRLALGIFHFYHQEEDDDGRRRVMSTSYLLLAVTYAAAAVGTVVLAPGIAQFVFGEAGRNATYIRIAAVGMMFEGLILVPTSLFQLQDRSRLFVYANLSRLGLQVVCNIILLVPLHMGVLGVLISGLIANGALAVALAVWMLREVGARFGGAVARSFLRFGMPLIVMNLATYIATFGDRYFLNKAADTTQVGLYGLAYQFGFLISAIGFGPFRQIWDPQRFAVAKRPDRDSIFSQVFVYMNVYLLTMAVGAALFAGDALRLIAAPAFASAAAYVPILGAAYVLQAWAFYLNLGIYVTERTGWFAVANWGAAIVAVIGYVVLIPRWLAWGATLSTLASMAVLCWLSYAFSQMLWHVDYKWGRVWRLVALATGIGTASALLPPMHLLLSIGAHGVLFTIYVALVWTLPILTPDEREAVRVRVVRRLRLREEAA